MAAEMSADQKSEPATLEVGGEEVKMEMPETREIDIHNRDPNNMNDHVKLKFEDLIGEPDPEIYSLDKVWQLSQKVYGGTRLWCYRITSAILAVPVSLCWGIYFACLSFCTIWCCIPCLKSCDIECLCFRKIYEVLISTCCIPCFEAAGMLFRNIRVILLKGDPEDNKKI